VTDIGQVFVEEVIRMEVEEASNRWRNIEEGTLEGDDEYRICPLH
jgi:hypothetical protein